MPSEVDAVSETAALVSSDLGPFGAQGLAAPSIPNSGEACAGLWGSVALAMLDSREISVPRSWLGPPRGAGAAEVPRWSKVECGGSQAGFRNGTKLQLVGPPRTTDPPMSWFLDEKGSSGRRRQRAACVDFSENGKSRTDETAPVVMLGNAPSAKTGVDGTLRFTMAANSGEWYTAEGKDEVAIHDQLKTSYLTARKSVVSRVLRFRIVDDCLEGWC